jgi:hypothetical protein
VTYPQPYQQPGYPQQPQYAPQAPPQPPYSPAPQGYPAAAPQNYPPQVQFQPPGYPPQGPAVPEGPPPTLNDFMTQPASAGGKSLPFNIPGTRYIGTVVRTITDADIEQATEVRGGGPAFHPDGRPKLIMKVPILMQPSPEYPTGIGVWYVKGNERSELKRAMEAAGADYPVPRGGDVIDVTYTHDEPGRSGMSPRKVKRVMYTVGNGIAPELPQANAGTQPIHPAPAQYQQPGYQPPPNSAPPFQTAPPQYMPDPALAYQQATGQPMPGFPAPAAAGQYATSAPPAMPPAPGPYGQPQADWNPYAQQVPPGPQVPGNTGWQQPQYQQNPFPTPVPAAPAAPPSGPVPPSGAPSPSYQQPGAIPVTQQAVPAPPQVPGGPPPDWPADVPFIPGLTVDQARVAATMHHPAAVNGHQQ